MNKFCITIFLILLFNTGVKSQDTINFRQFDSLKTSSEDKHKTVRKDPDNFDVSLFRSINNSHTKFKDDVLPYFDRSSPPMAFFLPIGMVAYSRFEKNYYDENTGFLLGISEGMNFILTFGTKFIVKRKRPYDALDNVNCRNTSITDPYSFPSGHTSISFAISTMFNLRYPKYPQVYVPMYLYSLIVAYGRPYFGMHYPTDLLGGAIIGAGSSILIFSLRSHLVKAKNKILKEDFPDEGSIKGSNAWIFGGAFVISSLVGQLISKDNQKIQVMFSPYGKNNEMMNFNINYHF